MIKKELDGEERVDIEAKLEDLKTGDIFPVIDIYAGMTTIRSTIGMGLAFSFSVIVGVFFGYYPAYKASKLDPVDALRS